MADVDKEIAATQTEIENLILEIHEARVRLESVQDDEDEDEDGDEDDEDEDEDEDEDRAYWNKELQWLGWKLEHLRPKLEHLRRKMKYLQEEKLLLLRLAAKEYLKRAYYSSPLSAADLLDEQLKPSGPLVNNWRPNAHKAGGELPELTHPVFARVLTCLADNGAPDAESVDTAAKLCSVGAQLYHQGKDALAAAVWDTLVLYLEAEGCHTIRSGFAREASPYWALGDAESEPTNLFLIVQVTTGLYSDHGDSHMDAANCYLHFWRERREEARFWDTCCPAFLLEVVGPHVRLSALAWLDRITVFPLTPLLNLLPAHPRTDRLVLPVARLLAALRMGLRHLARVPKVPRPLPAGAKELALPWPISHDPRYVAATAARLTASTFRVELAATAARISSDDGSAGSSSGGSDSDGSSSGGSRAVVVKLSRGYGLEAHRAWAALGLAPKVLRARALPCGWQLVEMECLPSSEWVPVEGLAGADREQALGAALGALQAAHDATQTADGAAAVHGDARPANCLARRGKDGSWKVVFLDFEWSGREGEATYPPFLNPKIPWPDGVAYNQPLQRRHDTELFRATASSEERGGGGGGGGGNQVTGPAGVVRSLPAGLPLGGGMNHVRKALAPVVVVRPPSHGLLGWRRHAAGSRGGSGRLSGRVGW